MYQDRTRRPKHDLAEGNTSCRRRHRPHVAALLALLMMVGWDMYRSLEFVSTSRPPAPWQAHRLSDRSKASRAARAADRAGGRAGGTLRRSAPRRRSRQPARAHRHRGASLNQRIETLGARERELAEVSQALAQAKQRIATLEERQAANRQRLNTRFTTLGERDRDLARPRSLSDTQLRSSNCKKRSGSSATRRPRTRRPRALDLQVGTLDGGARNAPPPSPAWIGLDTTQTLLKETQEQLDKALLAQSVGELQARSGPAKAARRARGRAPPQGALFDRSIDVGRGIATLDQRCARSPTTLRPANKSPT